MVGYSQYSGACGLTSLLMAIQPESNGISEILDYFWNKISHVFNSNAQGNSYNWQRVMEWLLFQSGRNPELIKLLKSRFGDALNDYLLPVLQDRIDKAQRRKNKYYQLKPKLRNNGIDNSADLCSPNNIDNNANLGNIHSDNKSNNNKNNFVRGGNNPSSTLPKLTSSWIMSRVNVWKMDFELEILAYIFGSKFKPWDTHDGTGAVFFTKDDIDSRYNNSNISKSSTKPMSQYREKIEFLTPYINNLGPVLCCASFHWLAIKEIRKDEGRNDYLITYNDPAGGRESSRYLSSFPKSYRFYTFKFDEELLEKNKSKLMKIDFSITM